MRRAITSGSALPAPVAPGPAGPAGPAPHAGVEPHEARAPHAGPVAGPGPTPQPDPARDPGSARHASRHARNAPWPYTRLDVAAARAAGHPPHPIRQFVLKTRSRCNLACTYCYVYEMADQGWRDQPVAMAPATTARAAQRIAEHAAAHDLPRVDLVLHGGEPLLTAPAVLAAPVEAVRAALAATTPAPGSPPPSRPTAP